MYGAVECLSEFSVGEEEDDRFGDDGGDPGGDEAVVRDEDEVGDDVEGDSYSVDLEEFSLFTYSNQAEAEERIDEGEESGEEEQLKGDVASVVAQDVSGEEAVVHNELHHGAG